MAEQQLHEQVAQLTAHCDAGKLSAGDERFARSLISKADSPKFSVKQVYWVGELVKRATQVKESAQTIEVGDMTDLYQFFLDAREHLKFPKLTVRLPDDTPVKLYMSGVRSRYPDTINVVLPDEVTDNGRNVWLGRIHANGTWELPHVPHTSLPMVRDLVEALQQDAHGVAASYGQKTGNCCFCMRGLSDDRSVAVGYGKVCSQHWGLYGNWKRG